RSVARFAGSGLSWASYPRFADSPGASVLSPASRAPVFLGHRTPGSRTHRGPAFCRPLCGLRSFLGIVPPVRGLTRGQRSVAHFARSGLPWASCPRFANSPGASVLSPALRAPVFLGHRTPGSRTHRGATFCSPLRGLMLLTSACDGRSMALPTLGVLVPSTSGDFSFGFLRIAVQSEHQTRPFLALLSVP